MNEPQSLDSLFKGKIFRIPDYQRGYAWQKNQLRDFWEDLINLPEDRSHYTGVLTLKEVDSTKTSKTENEYWLIDEHSYKMYHIVDGQQRLATCVVFLQALIDFMKRTDENKNKEEQNIYITESLSLNEVAEKYLYKKKPVGDQYRTYKFGYTEDHPSHEYLKYKIFNENGSPSIDETFYTLNLRNAKQYFEGQIEEIHAIHGMLEIQKIYKKITKKFLFNEYAIKDEFNVFVAFETMNNRGKPLSDLELLKNRLIYLTTLYTDDEIDEAERTDLRDAINASWKEVYRQLGRNDKHPLNDDDFLKAHWTMYFQYSRQKGNDYIKFLLDEQFSPKRIYKNLERKLDLELPEEQSADEDVGDTDNEDNITYDPTLSEDNFSDKNTNGKTGNGLKPVDIKEYVISLKESAVHWFNSYYPHLATELSNNEKNAIECLNRVGIGYFRPLVMSLLKNAKNSEQTSQIINEIERFIFIVFRLSQNNSNYKSSEFLNASRDFNQEKLTLDNLHEKLKTAESHCYNDDGTFNSNDFYNYLYKKFYSGKKNGYYEWSGLHHFLYEYELNLLSQSRQKKIEWEDLRKTPRDCVTIEHIFPQTPTKNWKKMFFDVDEHEYPLYSGSIGNLLLLSKSINSSLQNIDFNDKKNPKYSTSGDKVRNGYSDGSHSEIQVSKKSKWTPEEIEGRGLDLLCFMEKRWKIRFKEHETKKTLLFPREQTERGKQ